MDRETANLQFQFIVPGDDLLDYARQVSATGTQEQKDVAAAVLRLNEIARDLIPRIQNQTGANLAPYFDFWFGDSVEAAQRLMASPSELDQRLGDVLLKQENVIAGSRHIYLSEAKRVGYARKSESSTDPTPAVGWRITAGEQLPDGATLAWHYTTVDHLRRIVVSGEIRPATAGVPANVKKAVWFSLNQFWEETANKLSMDAFGDLVPLTRQQTHDRSDGLARIGVLASDVPNDWKRYKQESGDNSAALRLLYNAAIRSNAKPGEWRVSFGPIPASLWKSVQVWSGEKWVDWKGP
jgi:hypothetical protein